jgi:hypothetical protein
MIALALLHVEDCRLSLHPEISGESPTGFETVEVAYDLDVDSFNTRAHNRVGYFHRRSDHSPHLPGSGVLLLVLAGMFIYQGLNAVQ